MALSMDDVAARNRRLWWTAPLAEPLAWTREARAIAYQGWLMARHIRRLRVPVEGPRAAVFVHGFMAAGPVFDPMRAQVEAELGIPTLDFSYWSHLRVETVAQQLADFIDTHVPAEAPVALVGHSLGGLVARWYIQCLGGARRVDRLVTLATPHGGTDSVRFAPGPLAESLRPGSKLLARLGDRAGDVPHTVLVAGRDTAVTPPCSAGAVSGAEIVWRDDLGHNELLFDPEVHALVVRALGATVDPAG